MIKGEGQPRILCDHTDWQRIGQSNMDKCKCGKVRYRSYEREDRSQAIATGAKVSDAGQNVTEA